MLRERAFTLPIQGIVTAPPVSSTTMVCGLAAATAATSASWLSGKERLAASEASLGRLVDENNRHIK